MPWHIGIDEAGYGPNMGPLLQTAVGVRFPAQPRDAWRVLAKAVRRHGESDEDDSRVIIDDSKKVYGAPNGLSRLELGVLAALCPPDTPWPVPLGHFLAFVAPKALVDLIAEPWFDEFDPLPAVTEPGAIRAASQTFHAARQKAKLSPFWVRSRVTPPALFNSLLDECANKAEVLATGLHDLIIAARMPDDDVVYAIDRQGGRIYYVALLQHACPDGWVEIVEETAACCRYRMSAGHQVSWSFEVEAESRHFTVALASMVSKFVREVLMRQFNRYWQKHVPGIKATAGYPVDSHRFFAEIQPAMRTLRVGHRLVWRRK
jgi:ribonuclease HII